MLAVVCAYPINSLRSVPGLLFLSTLYVPRLLINRLGSVLKTYLSFIAVQVELPPWTDIVKTARFKELAPYDPDWYYVRAGQSPLIFTCSPCIIYCLLVSLSHQTYSASMARKIYLRGGLGVGAFKRIYGGSKRNGSRPPHFCESSGAIARHILQQLQEMNIVDVDPKG